jgi:hypothetical protein
MNANGNIIIESPSSIIIRSPTIVFDGQVTNTNVTGINLGNYNSVVSPNIQTTNVNGYTVQSLQGFNNVRFSSV